MPRVTVITTMQHNVGDDFVRDGITYLLSRVLPKMELELVHKHLPITARPQFSWLHSLRIDRLKHVFARRIRMRYFSP